jgi:hypothetical protein
MQAVDISTRATCDRQTRHNCLVTEFAARSRTMKEDQLVAEAENMLDSEIANIARLELERREMLNGA